MIRMRPQRRLHVPNRLALIGALVLTITLFSGFNGSGTHESEFAAGGTATQDATEQTEQAKHKKRFSVSQLLFGHG